MIQDHQISLALYVHVPFCQARCAYCDFNTYAGLDDLIPAYAAALGREMEATSQRLARPTASTVYFGGGTPSLLPPDLLATILDQLRVAFDLSPRAEISLEANPGTVTPARLRRLRDLGINRLSLGVQSADARELALLGRIHTWEQAVEAFDWARKAGFDNLNLDLIFGLPDQTVARWQETLEAALALGPEHLSLYCLTVEEGTPLATSIAEGAIPAPDEDVAAEMMELAEDLLAAAGFFHYEISNWARTTDPVLRPDSRNWWPGSDADSESLGAYVCRHNLVYWRNEPWLGLGAGAHSWLAGRRWANVSHPRAYVAHIDAGTDPAGDVEEIDRRTEIGETMMMGLRLAEGVSDARFRARFGDGLAACFERELDEQQDLGLLTWDGIAVRLTARGRLVGNQVFARFL